MQFSSVFFSGENGNLDLEKKIKMGKDIYNLTFLVGYSWFDLKNIQLKLLNNF